jgi:FGGY-family pentulose kinase
MMKYLLGIDGGTECIKSGIYDLNGNLIAMADYKYDTINKHPGWAEQKAEQWKIGLVESIRKAIRISEINPEDICGIGYDATCCSVVFMNGSCKPLRDPIIWMDVRATEEAEFIDTIDDPARKYNGYGKVSPEWFPCKVLWVKRNEPHIYNNSTIIAEYTDWLTYMLTGKWTLGISTVTVRGYYDNRSGGWPVNFYKKIGLETLFEKLPKSVLRVGEYVSGLNKEIAESTGLMEGTPVGQGAFDAACGMIGSNAFNTGQVFLITGSSNYFQINVDKEFHANGVFGSYPDVVIDNFAIECGQTSTGSVLKWYKTGFLNKTITDNANKNHLEIYDYMNVEAEKIPLGSEGLIVLEHWQGNRTPFTDPKSRGVIAGLSLKHTPFHVYRAIMEATAYGTEAALRVIKKNNFKITEIIACGGQVKSKLWTQIYADVTGIPIKLTTNPEATTLGSAILGGVASKKFVNLQEAANTMVHYKETIVPDMKNHKKYKPYVDNYIKTYKSLKNTIHRISEFHAG